ncbi:Facilitated trehalose transporter Tret1-2-like protein [Frankliniella fusca]|uniref:Facilitated trehalose transporter Tret1-2-like protein n=1 Tax=Frankliniella fusca TaxID=407009 RepID=A0AAE1LIK7_9NEOP|nr:Facilitated trehalose transporter Tret1-2-like protein [Frankliniella fusca]
MPADQEDAEKSAYPLLERGGGEATAATIVVVPKGDSSKSLSRTPTATGVAGLVPNAPPLHWHLLCAGVVANLSAVCGGFVYSWSSPMLPVLQDPSAPAGFVISLDEAAWVGSLTPLGAAFGPIPGGLFADRFGRRPTLIVSGALMLTAWVLAALANSALWLYASRFIGGFVTGVVSCILPLYLGEIAVDRVRSALGTAMQLSLTLGFMVPYAVGPYVSPMTLACVLASCCLLYFMASIRLPESPYLLCLRGDSEAASKALQWLRGQSRDQCYKELRRMEEETQGQSRRRPPLQTFIRVFATPGGRRAFFLVCALMLFQQLSGINAVLFYAQDILKRAFGGSPWLSPALGAILIGLVQVVASVSSVALTACVSMKTLFIVSSLCAATAHAALGYFFHLVATGQDTSSIAALPLASLCYYIVVYCLGLGSVPWALLGEVFGADVKAASSAMCASIYWVIGFFVTQFFGRVMEAVGADYTFWGLGGCCVLSAAFAFAMLPNTKGKSLQEIQDILNGRK